MNSTKTRDKHQFGGNREIAIQRDGEKCVQCELSRAEHMVKYNRDITVDHIDGNGRRKPKHLKNNSLDNLQTLCLSCHGKKDSPLWGNTYRKQSNFSKGEKHGRAKLTQEDVDDIRMFYEHGLKRIDIARAYPVSAIAIWYILNNRRWVNPPNNL